MTRRWMGLPPDDPAHLPSVTVDGRGPTARRVRIEDLEQFCQRLELPAVGQLMRPGDAIALLAGRTLRPGTTAYLRLWQRLEAAAAEGRIEVYRLPGMREKRFAFSEVNDLQKAYVQEGVTSAARSRMRSLKGLGARGAALGLASVAEIAESESVDESTVCRWARLGRYGARRIGGCWFLDPVLVEYRHWRDPEHDASRALEERVRSLWLAGVGADQIARDLQLEFPGVTVRHVRSIRRHLRLDHRSDAYGAAMRQQWAEGRRDRIAAKQRIVDVVAELVTSKTRFPAWQAARLLGRHGRRASPEQLRTWSGRALSRAQRKSARSKNADELKDRLSILWSTPMTVEQIARELYTTPGRVKSLRSDLGLPRRSPGRPPRK